MVKIGIAGVGGRMGKMLVRAVAENPHATLISASEKLDSPLIGEDAGLLSGINALGVPVAGDSIELYRESQVVIDFTQAQATSEHIQMALENHIPMVIGTTGLTPQTKLAIQHLAEKVPVIYSPNFSVGVNLLLTLVAQAAKILQHDYDIEIIEAHHRYKVDAPSGTALQLGEVIAQTTQRPLDSHAIYARHGHTGPRNRDHIGFSVIRGGDIVGDHTVMFAGDDERIEITHRASSRMTFARGAVKAACWLANQNPGLYDMGDVLGLKH